MNIFMEGENDEAVCFKDEDLTTLKDQLEDMIDTTKGTIPVINIGARSLKALLARLEVSERVCKAADGLSHGVDWNEGTHAIVHGYREKLLMALKAWRKACGK